MKNIYGIIRKLGVTSKYNGYFFLTDAIHLAMDSQDKSIKITKDIYPCLAKKYETTPMNIERNVRTVINICWETNKEGMDEIAGHSLSCKPTNSEFVKMVVSYLAEEQTGARPVFAQ
ncbi:MAG: sporulation initiation factor Spo0A C-terminal domain-containing protein [Eubacteriales bacterium]|nr:sporulation initiation factor Spo0A C-terminal domain-containing protein [Eubacteriales bacterium]